MMAIIIALLVCLTIRGTFAEKCLNPLTCPCGIKGYNVTVCVARYAHTEVCRVLSKCEACIDGFNFCTKCPEGFSGLSCYPDSLARNHHVYCYHPEQIPNSQVRYFATGSNVPADYQMAFFSVGSKVEYTCNRMYVLRGKSTLTCESTGNWSENPPKCVPEKCINAKRPKFASVLCTSGGNNTNICTATCYDGHYFEETGLENMTIICKDGVWTPRTSFPACKSRGYCDLTPQKEAYVKCSSTINRRSCTITCSDKPMVYEAYCEPLKRNIWNPPLPPCVTPKVKTTCKDPGFIENGVRRNTDGSESTINHIYEEGQAVVYSCITNDFALQGFPFLTCKQDGHWSSSLPACIRQTSGPGAVKFCQDPGVDTNGRRLSETSPDPRGFNPGSLLEYSCNQGYALNGEWSIICLTTGEWTASPPICETQKAEVDQCENPGVISNGQVVYYPISGNRRLLEPLDEPEFPDGSRLEYFCDDGYTLLGQKNLVCEKPGFWSEGPPFCRRDVSRRKYCQDPGNIANGRVEHIPVLNQIERRPSNGDQEEYPEGSRLRYSCDEGYIPDGPATLKCKRSGSWSPAEPPICINADDNDRVTCENPGRVLNGILLYFAPGERNGQGLRLDTEMEEYPEGSTLEYYCAKGFWLQGSQSLVCHATGFWSAGRPKCIGDCGRSFVPSTVRIRDGQETVSGEWPWMVSISLQEGNGARFVCGGAVYNTRTVVTAAHCLETDRTYILRFGKHQFEDDDSGVLNRTSSRFIIHPDYFRRTFDSDIGLILFDPPIEYSRRVQPICMPTPDTTIRNIVPGNVGYVSGWGITELDLPSKSLLYTGLPVLSRTSCVQSYMSQNLTVPMTANKFCAGYLNGSYSVCSGDSGSPFVFYDNLSHRYTLEGLVSFLVRRRQDAQECGLPGRYAIFTRVYRFVPWIYENAQ